MYPFSAHYSLVSGQPFACHSSACQVIDSEVQDVQKVSATGGVGLSCRCIHHLQFEQGCFRLIYLDGIHKLWLFTLTEKWMRSSLCWSSEGFMPTYPWTYYIFLYGTYYILLGWSTQIRCPATPSARMPFPFSVLVTKQTAHKTSVFSSIKRTLHTHMYRETQLERK